MNVHPLPAPTGDLAGRRVAKKIRPDQRGAIKLARMHGEALLCVRHRENADGSKRLMTGGLLLEMAVIQTRDDPIVSFKIKPKEIGLRRPAQSKGGWYEGKNFRKLAAVRSGAKRGKGLFCQAEGGMKWPSPWKSSRPKR